VNLQRMWLHFGEERDLEMVNMMYRSQAGKEEGLPADTYEVGSMGEHLEDGTTCEIEIQVLQEV
jgi:hypothetical protein